MRIISAIFWITEKVIAELALLAALLSTTEGGTYFDRIVGGMFDNFRAIYGFIRAYAANVKFVDFMAAFKEGINDALDAVSLNVQMDSRRVLLAMLFTFIAWNVVALILRIIRKKLLRCRKDDDECGRKPGKGGGGKTYEKLYDKEQPAPHTTPSHPTTPAASD